MTFMQKAITILILNILDVGFTQFHVVDNHAEELNPIINYLMAVLGTAWVLVKILWVAILLWLVGDLYPKLEMAVRIKIHKALTAIIAYHIYLFTII